MEVQAGGTPGGNSPGPAQAQPQTRLSTRIRAPVFQVARSQTRTARSPLLSSQLPSGLVATAVTGPS